MWEVGNSPNQRNFLLLDYSLDKMPFLSARKQAVRQKIYLKGIRNPKMPSFLFYRKPSWTGGEPDVPCVVAWKHKIWDFAVRNGVSAVLRWQGRKWEITQERYRCWNRQDCLAQTHRHLYFFDLCGQQNSIRYLQKTNDKICYFGISKWLGFLRLYKRRRAVKVCGRLIEALRINRFWPNKKRLNGGT